MAPPSPTGFRAADHQPAANTDAVATITAIENGRIHGVEAHWSYSDAPTGGKLTIKSGSTVISEVDVTASGPGFLPLNGLETSPGEALSATLAAAGASVSGKVTLTARLV